MFKFFLGKYDRRRRKLYVPNFSPVARLEILMNQWIDLYYMDTSMALDRGGNGPERIAYYERERPVFFQKHGQELLEYLSPYDAVPKNKLLLPDEFRRVDALLRLRLEAKKAENEKS